MDNEEIESIIHKYLEENLKVSIEQDYDYRYITTSYNRFKVRLTLNDQVISSDVIDIPTNDDKEW
jgi:hypothetical protein